MSHPYQHLAPYRYWNTGVLPSAGVGDLALVQQPKFVLGPRDRIATMGSCFAQHVGRQLSEWGFEYYFLETERTDGGPPIFSCRYGNVYTPRQALQLLDRCDNPTADHGEIWERAGRYFDAYRPLVHPEGFGSRKELEDDRTAHLRNVAALVRSMDVLVFTLGLTEAWTNRENGTVYPSAPGVIAGDYQPESHAFHNFRVDEVVDDLRAFVMRLKALNPRLRIVLSVSPVAIAATYEERHVLVSSTYTKAVLRVAADTVTREFDYVDYLPTYEAIIAPSQRYRYVNADCRTVTPAGVRQAMRLFRSFFPSDGSTPGARPYTPVPPRQGLHDVLCDEELNQSS